LRDLSIQSYRNLFFPLKKTGSCTSEGRISMKESLKRLYFFGFVHDGKLATCSQNFVAFRIGEHISKKWKVQSL